MRLPITRIAHHVSFAARQLLRRWSAGLRRRSTRPIYRSPVELHRLESRDPCSDTVGYLLASGLGFGALAALNAQGFGRTAHSDGSFHVGSAARNIAPALNSTSPGC